MNIHSNVGKSPIPVNVSPHPAEIAAHRLEKCFLSTLRFDLRAEERAARFGLDPTDLRLFSPTVVVHGHGLSLVRWWTADRTTGYQESTDWVKLDLSSIHACGDLSIGRRRFCLMLLLFRAGDRFVSK